MPYYPPLAHSKALDDVKSSYDYLVFSESEGVVSSHCSATQASQALAAHVAINPEQIGVMILKREGRAWGIF